MKEHNEKNNQPTTETATAKENELKMNMSQDLYDTLHREYVKASQNNCVNAVDVEEHLFNSLDKIEVHGDDEDILDYMLDKLVKSIHSRKQTFQATNFCSEILHACLFIVAWLNKNYGTDIDAETVARRKSLESELVKMISLADDFDPTQVLDRFGIRLILHEGIEKACFLLVKTLNVLCNLNRQDKKDFLNFVENYPGADDVTRYRIKKLLEVPLVLTPLVRKDDPSAFNPDEFLDENGNQRLDLPTENERKLVEHLSGNIKFYFDPKKNGYQSIHFILMVDPSSTVLPGFQIEFQIRTWKMHIHAENDINASHDVHKDKTHLYRGIFTLSEEELKKANIRFFNSYKDVENDADGIHFPKKFADRRGNESSM